MTLALGLLCAAPKKSPKLTGAPTKVQSEDVIAHLESAIVWYHHVGAAEQLTGVPTDLVVRDATLQRSQQALQLAFDFARAEAAFLAAEKAANTGVGVADAGSTGRSLSQAALQAGQRVTAVQEQIALVADKLTRKSSPNDRAVLEARSKELDAELVLSKQVQTTLQGILSVVGDSGLSSTSSAGLRGQIETLEKSVPEVRHKPKIPETAGQKTPAAATNQPTASAVIFHPEDAGLISLGTQIITLSRAKAELDDLLSETDDVLKDVDRLKAPLVGTLKASMKHSQDLITNSDGQNAAQIEKDQKEIEALTVQFKELATATVPIGEEQLLVEATRTNLAGWRNAMARQSGRRGEVPAISNRIYSVRCLAHTRCVGPMEPAHCKVRYRPAA